MKTSILSFLSFILYSSIVFGGVKVVAKSDTKGNCNGNKVDYSTTTMYLRSDIMRIDMTGMNGLHNAIIYQKNAKKVWIIDHVAKNYYSIEEQDFKEINEQMQKMKEMLEKQLENVPEDQREQMRKMMTANAPLLQGNSKTELKKTSVTETINNWSSEQYEYFENDKLTQKIWVADFSALKLTKEDFNIIFDFSDFMSSSFNMFSFGGANGFLSPDQDLNGVPVKTITMVNSSECSISTIESVKKETLSDDLFKMPTDYRKEENPMRTRQRQFKE